MTLKLVTYYRKRNDEDLSGQNLYHVAETEQADQESGGGEREGRSWAEMHGDDSRWRVGHVTHLGPEEESPFLGAIKHGEGILSAEAGPHMFRTPAVPHSSLPTDFLLLRSSDGSYSLREATGCMALGQLQPAIVTPQPHPYLKQKLNDDLILATVTRNLRNKMTKLSRGKKITIRVDEVRAKFPRLSPAEVVEKLRKCGCIPSPDDPKKYILAPDRSASLPTFPTNLALDSPTLTLAHPDPRPP